MVHQIINGICYVDDGIKRKHAQIKNQQRFAYLNETCPPQCELSVIMSLSLLTFPLSFNRENCMTLKYSIKLFLLIVVLTPFSLASLYFSEVRPNDISISLQTNNIPSCLHFAAIYNVFAVFSTNVLGNTIIKPSLLVHLPLLFFFLCSYSQSFIYVLVCKSI